MEGKIKITSSAITKDETVNRKSTSFINYGKQEG